MVNIIEKKGKDVLTSYQIKIMALATKVAKDATSVSQQDIDQLKDEGLTDEHIFDLVSAASARCFFSKISDALGAQPDVKFHQTSQTMQDLLVLGREISTEKT